ETLIRSVAGPAPAGSEETATVSPTGSSKEKSNGDWSPGAVGADPPQAPDKRPRPRTHRRTATLRSGGGAAEHEFGEQSNADRGRSADHGRVLPVGVGGPRNVEV